jgi:hypothetical protein
MRSKSDEPGFDRVGGPLEVPPVLQGAGIGQVQPDRFGEGPMECGRSVALTGHAALP